MFYTYDDEFFNNIIKPALVPPKWVFRYVWTILFLLMFAALIIIMTKPASLIKYFSNLDIFNNNNKKIGLFWQGNKKIFKNRSISFDILSHILKLKNITWYSFQYENGVENIEGLYNLNNYIKNYDDTAALLYNIDLLITIDSSIAHMAGALGIKTLLLLPYTAEWRWFNDTKTTPWYNSIEIFRQTKINDWNSVINKVKEELLSYAY